MIIKRSPTGNTPKLVPVKQEFPREYDYLIISETGLYPQEMNRFKFWTTIIAEHEEYLSTWMFFTGSNWWITVPVEDRRLAKMMGGLRKYWDPVTMVWRMQRFELTTKFGFSAWRWVDTHACHMDKSLAQTYEEIDSMDDDEIASINNANCTTAESLLCDEVIE